MIRKMTRQEYEQEFGKAPSITSAPQQNQGNFFTGLGKSALSTVKGVLDLEPEFTKKIFPKSEGAKRAEDRFFGKEATQTRGTGEKMGKFVGDVAQFAIPGTAATKATK